MNLLRKPDVSIPAFAGGAGWHLLTLGGLATLLVALVGVALSIAPLPARQVAGANVAQLLPRGNLWVVLLGLASLLAAMLRLVDKDFAECAEAPPFVCAGSSVLVAVPVCVAGLLLAGPLGWPDVLIGAAAGGSFTLATVQYFRVLRRTEASSVEVLGRLNALPAFAAGVIFLGDVPDSKHMVAFVLLLGAALLMAVKPAASGLPSSSLVVQVSLISILTGLTSAALIWAYRRGGVVAGISSYNLGVAVTVALMLLASRGCRRECLRTRPRTWLALGLRHVAQFCIALPPAYAASLGVPAGVVVVCGSVRPALVWALERWFNGTHSREPGVWFKVLGCAAAALGSLALL